MFNVTIKCEIENKNQDLNVRRVDVIKENDEFNIACFATIFVKGKSHIDTGVHIICNENQLLTISIFYCNFCT